MLYHGTVKDKQFQEAIHDPDKKLVPMDQLRISLRKEDPEEV